MLETCYKRRRMRRTSVLPVLVMLASVTATLTAQSGEACPLPTRRPLSQPILFSEEQEMFLGDIISEHLERNFKVVRGPINDNLQTVGARLAAQVPGSKITFRFTLIDMPMVNAFALPGGRIYVTRKMVAAVRTEDELAGVMSHEVSHILARHSAIDFSVFMREILKVTSLGDKADVQRRYHELEESYAKKQVKIRKDHGEREQLEADRIGLYIAARAGYRPEAHIEFWDRMAETHGETGNWFTDLFGVTKPESKRLGEMLKSMKIAAPGCQQTRAGSVQDFKGWQQAVIENVAAEKAESLPGLVRKQTLEPPLRSDISHLRFSTNGKYVIAQDNSSVFVAQRKPFELIFRADAKEAFPAQFTPDGEELVLYNRSLRVERWRIPEKKRIAVAELALTDPCLQTELSPTGKLLACFTFEELRLLDVETNQDRFRKKAFYVPQWFDLFSLFFQSLMENPHYVELKFSPDGKYFLAGKRDSTLGLDTTNLAKELRLPGNIRSLMGHSFDFQAPDRFIGVNGYNPSKSALVRFPTGETIAKLPLGNQRVEASHNNNLLLLRPIKDYPLGVFRISDSKLVVGNRSGAIDADAENYVTETAAGEVSIFPQNKTERDAIATLHLPRSPLSTIRAFAISEDLRYLAISERTRGAVYDLETGKRIFHVRGFRGVHVRNGTVYAEFPEFEDQKRALGEMRIADGTFGKETSLEKIDAVKVGQYMVEMKPAKKNQLDKNVTFIVQDSETMATLWTQPFAQGPPRYFPNAHDDKLILRWDLRSNAAKSILKSSPELAEQALALNGKDKDAAYLIQVLAFGSGKLIGQMILPTGAGSFRPDEYLATDEHLIVADSKRRILIYSLKTGQIQGRLFADRMALSCGRRLLALDTDDGKVELYSLSDLSGSKKTVYTFPTKTSYVQFSPDGQKLLVLTDDQSVYTLDVSVLR
jgi:WD40 repeat protein